jgi:hypothetical protein
MYRIPHRHSEHAWRYACSLRRVTRLLRGFGLEAVQLLRALFQGPFQVPGGHALRVAQRDAARGGVPLALGIALDRLEVVRVRGGEADDARLLSIGARTAQQNGATIS